jgi:hypothetical protein
MARFLFLACGISALACAVGPKPSGVGPAGVWATLTVHYPERTTQISGELLAADGAGLTLLTVMEGISPSVVLVSYRAIGRAQLTRIIWTGESPPDSAQLFRLRLQSRYPQGISPELLDKLIRAYGQDSVYRIPP